MGRLRPPLFFFSDSIEFISLVPALMYFIRRIESSFLNLKQPKNQLLPMRHIIGIDLGTTKSCVSVIENDKPVVIVNNQGGRTMPSIVAFHKNGEVIIGEAAKNQAISNPENTIMNIKRFIGRKWPELVNEVANNSYKVVRNSDDNVFVKIGNEQYSPQEISAFILQKLKHTAEQYLGQPISEAVVTVPAYFNFSQRQATLEACEIAGLKILRIINEPTAAALAYGIKCSGNQKIAVFDLGGGTFDISILELFDGVFQVKATNGNTYLGGNDFDKVIMDWLIGEFKKDEGIDLSKIPTAWQRLKECSERAKIELSTSQEVEINLPYIYVAGDVSKHLLKKITRDLFEKLSSRIIDQCFEICKQAIKDSNLSTTDISEVILVGESCRIPKVLESIEKFFQRKPVLKVNMVEAVSIGAAIQGSILNGGIRDTVLIDVTPFSLGIETNGGVMTRLIHGNSGVPTGRSQVFSTTVENQTSVSIHILQGERAMAKDNKTIGTLHIDGLPPRPKGELEIEVAFDIDANGILYVSAKNKQSGISKKERIEGGYSLTDNEMRRMRLRAIEYEEKQKKKNEKVLRSNYAENLILQALKLLNDSTSGFSTDKKVNLKTAINNLENSLKNDNGPSVSCIEELKKAM